MSILGAKTLIETLDLIEKGNAPRIKQDDSLSTYAPILSRNIACIDFSKTADEVFNLVRGTNPWPVAHTTILCKGVKIYTTSIVSLDNLAFKPGEVLASNEENRLIIGCKNSAIEILTLKPEGKKIMTAKDYLQGNKIKKGTILGI
ncbi:MAG: hypothetical protein RR483_03625 [Clostridia bacterium]